MTISSIGSSSYYTGQLSAMRNYATTVKMPSQMQQSAVKKNPDPSEIFNQLDQDGSGGLDQTEFQTLADKISEKTGEDVDISALFTTYDADGDGVLNEDETQTAMEANRPKGPPPMGGNIGGIGGHGGPDPSQMFSNADENEDGSLDETEFQTLAEKIAEATGEEVDVTEIFSAYDADGDGVLNEEEVKAVMEANRPEAPTPSHPESVMAESDGFQLSTSSFGMESYLKMAALGNEPYNMFDMFGVNGNSFSSSGLFSVNTVV
ncbi:MAG: EF-hand domain-containing protein [Proteobacteria bacterium]|nr:EF-hand domain-containing protein [Pseudomonadota bacterium]